MKRMLATLLVVAGSSVLMTGPAVAHTQTVSPPGQDAPVHDGRGIARPWVQGHCRAQAPAITGDASEGVVVFSPQLALDCPDHLNPGGQVTGP